MEAPIAKGFVQIRFLRGRNGKNVLSLVSPMSDVMSTWVLPTKVNYTHA